MSLSSSYEAAKVAYQQAQDAQEAAEDAQETADEALEEAHEAMTSADGKNKVFHQSTAPTTAAGLTAGDIWFDTGNDNRINTWTGSAWSAFELGTDAIANASIVNAKIADGTIQSAKIANLDAGKITSGTISTQSLEVVTEAYSLRVALDVDDSVLGGLEFYTGNEPDDNLCARLTMVDQWCTLYAGQDVSIYGRTGVSIGCGGAGSLGLSGDVNVNGTFNGHASSGIEHGRVSVTAAASTAGSTHITFGAAFDAAPAITVTPHASAPQNVHLGVANTSATGFDLTYWRSTAGTFTVSWIACG